MKRNIKQALALALILVLTSFCMPEGFAQGVVSGPTKKTQKTVKTTGQKNPNHKKSSPASKGPTPLTKKNTNPSTPSQPKPEKKPTSGYINGHEWVDLGLPSGLKWATCNVGASTPEAYGNYYAWGETNTKSTFTEVNCLTYGKDIASLKAEGIIDAYGQLNKSYDAASANWGSTWRTPTKEEFVELSNKCKWKWTSLNGKNGYKVTGPNGNSIFISASGFRSKSSHDYIEDSGWYLSSSNDSNFENADILYFSEDKHGISPLKRYYGRSVRAVSE